MKEFITRTLYFTEDDILRIIKDRLMEYDEYNNLEISSTSFYFRDDKLNLEMQLTGAEDVQP